MKFFKRKFLKKVGEKVSVSLIMFSTLFYSFGGLDLYYGYHTPFAPKHADASYTGKHVKTVEYILGGNTENVVRLTGVISYFGSATSTTKAGAGTKSVVLEGANISVKSAYLDVSYIVTTAANMTNESVSLDVVGSSSGGTSATTSQELSTTAYTNSGLSGFQRHVHDVTSFFDRQSDTLWHSGVGVVAGIAVTGPPRMLTTIKLVITYESDYSLISHNETKTVRFPLDSLVAGDSGTRGAQCAAAATCSFVATSTIPDLAANADVLDVYVELHGQVDSGTASTFRVGIRGGNASSSLYAWTEALVDDTVVNAIWRPAVGVGTAFQPNTTQIYDLQMGTVPMNALGGELVITYRYSTNATAQTETVRYFLNQGTATTLPNVRSNFATITPAISNGTLSVKNIWFKAHTAATTTANFTLIGKVGTTTEISNTIAISGVQVRSGDDHTIILDLSSQAGQFWNSTTTIAGATQFNASGGAVVALEAYFTFTWDGSNGGAQTQTVTFPGAQQGTNAVANQWNNTPVYIDLPETVPKTYRSAYIEAKYMHSNAGTITTGTVTIGANGSTTVISETGDITVTTGEAYTSTYFAPIASSTFSNGDTISWTERAIEIIETKSVANTAEFTNQVVVTYDVDYSQTNATPNVKHLRTVEYILGGNTENIARATAVISYFGSATSTTKAGAGTQSIVLEGNNIAVKSAYLDVSYIITTVANMTNEAVSLDVAGSSSGGRSATSSQELSVLPYVRSGVSGYQRRMHDVSSFFDRQSDAAWHAGVGVVAGITVTGPTRMLTTIKLVITYETDYSLVAHNETKTVRFPLDSLVAGDSGTRATICAAAATCSFVATSTIPDAVADGDILDVYVEMHGETDSGAAPSTFRVGIRGGNASSSLYAWTETALDDTVVSATWSPSVGASTGFQRNTTQIYDVQMGTWPMKALGGELVVTYRFSTGAPTQTETVRYFLNQGATTTLPNIRSNFATITPTISNGTLSMKNIWFKAHTAATTTSNFTLIGKVGTTTEISNAISIATTSATTFRAGDDHTIILDLTSQSSQFYTSTSTIAGATQFNASGGAAVALEAYFTFTWAGNLGGQQTNTVTFPAGMQGTNAVANQWNNVPVYMDLPETVTKTYRNAYIETKYMHSQATNITVSSVTIGANGSTTNITETGDTAITTGEDYTSTYFTLIASSTFSNGDTISWADHVIEIRNTKGIANTGSFTNTVVVTYDSAQAYKFPTFTQNTYHFYVDNAAITPASAWPSGSGGTIGENTEITSADSPPGNGANVRLRMSLTVATTTMIASSTQFKLQFAKRVSTCGAIGSWTDMGPAAEWRGFNATPVDGSNLSTNPPSVSDLLLSVSSRAGLYSESNPTILNPFAVAVGEDVEYDWNIQNNGAATDTPYCFRMVKSDGSVFDNYSASYPTAMTAGYTAKTDAWRWYDDETNETPVTPLAGVNVAPSNVVNQNIIKLRLSVKETQGANGINQKFKMQYSEWADFSRGVTDVTSTTTCTVNSLWCYGDGVDTDNGAISTLLFSSTTAKGTHNEGTSSTVFSPLASTATEFEYTLKHAGARVNTTYYFRLWDLNHSRPVPLSTADGASYPSLSTQGATVSFSISGSATSSVVASQTTDVATTPTTVPFYTIPVGTTGVKAAYHLSISTDATEGYQVFMKANSDLVNQYGTILPNITGTNASPSAWATGCSSGGLGCYGYHATDATLSGGSTRFLIDDTYAQFSSTTLEEVMYNSGPVTNDTSDILFRVEAHTGLPAGAYTTSVQYIVVPIF